MQAVSRLLACTDCTIEYSREDAAFEWVAGEQVVTDTCWRCYDKDRPMVVPRLATYDSLASSWMRGQGANTKARRDRGRLGGRKH